MAIEINPDKHVARWGVTEHQLSQLANYNSEKERGLLHTPSWVEKMAELQKKYNAAQARHREKN